MAYNDGVMKFQEEKRQQTIQKVKDALDVINQLSPEAIVSRKLILKYADVSPAVLYKPYILKIWNPREWEIKYSNEITDDTNKKIYTNQIKNFEGTISKLEKEINILKAQKEKLKEQKEKQVIRTRVYLDEAIELREINERLLGVILTCERYLAIKGVSVAEIANLGVEIRGIEKDVNS